MPAITKNLLSISHFLRDNNVVIEFFSTHCVVKDLITRQVLLKGVLINDLYQLNLDHLPSVTYTSLYSAILSCNNSVPFNSNKYLLWHYRLGHPSSITIASVLNDLHIPINPQMLSSVILVRWEKCIKGILFLFIIHLRFHLMLYILMCGVLLMCFPLRGTSTIWLWWMNLLDTHVFIL